MSCIDCKNAKINPSTLEAYGAGDYYGYCENKNTPQYLIYSNLSIITSCIFHDKSKYLLIPGISYIFDIKKCKEQNE